MFVYYCDCEDQTICATTPKEAQLYHWDYVPTVFKMEVSDTATCIYRVYSNSLNINTYVETLEEAKNIIRSYHGQERRTIRRWRIPIEGSQQLTLF